MNAPESVDAELEHFWDTQRRAAFTQANSNRATWGVEPELPPLSPAEIGLRNFAEPLIRGALKHRDEADELIRKYAENWDLHRMAAVDRNILRLAIYEMLHREDVPPVVSINEAVEIAKKFSTDNSGKFINGILDRVRSGLMRPSRGEAELPKT